MLEARNARRVARGSPRSTSTPSWPASRRRWPTPALRAEVRQLVQARNARRARRGQPPLDVEAEVDRQLKDLGAL